MNTSAKAITLGILNALPAVQEADHRHLAVYDHVPELRQAAEQIAADLTQALKESQTEETDV